MPIAALLATVAGIGGSIAMQRGDFWLGGALLVLSVVCLRWPRSVWGEAPVPEPSPAARRLAVVAVCLAGVFFRVYRLNHPGLWGDDALNGLLAYDILDGKITSPFEIVAHSHSNFHALSNYPIAGAFWLFGADLTTLRLPGIVLGALCVPLLYGTVAPLFGRTVALIAALFFASSPPQILYAKQLVQIVTGEFFQLAGLCLLVRGLTGASPWLTAAAGLPLALCVYTYHSARIAPAVALFFGLASLWQNWRARRAAQVAHPAAARPRALGWELGAALIVFATALAPAIVGYIDNPEALVKRVGATSIWPIVREQGWWPLWDTVWRTLLVFHYEQGPEYHWFGIATDPALNAVLGFLVLHGLLQSLLRVREPRHLLLLAWFAVGLAPGLLSTGAPRLYRAFLSLPPVYVWAALPLARCLATATGLRGRAAPLLRAVAVVLIAAVPLIDFNYYFYRVYTSPVFRWFQGERIVEMARALRDAGPGWTGYLLTDTFDTEHESFRFLARAWNLDLIDVASLSDVLPLRDVPERGALFIMSAANVPVAAAVAGVYPGAELQHRLEPDERSWWLDAWLPLAEPSEPLPRIAAAIYPVSRAAAEQPRLEPRHGLDVRYVARRQPVERHDPYPYYFFMAPPFPYSGEAVWSGRLTVPEPGGYRLEAESTAPVTMHVDGRFLERDDRLPAGTHDFLLQTHGIEPRFRMALFWRVDDEPRQLIPREAFTPPTPAAVIPPR